MTTIQFLLEWAIRSFILIASGALLLWVLQVRDSSIRLAAWTAMLCGSLAIPLLTTALPNKPLPVMRSASVRIDAPAAPAFASPNIVTPKRFDWSRAAVTIYALGALALLLRLCIGLAMSLRLLHSSRATERATHGIPIHESDRVATPVTLGIVRPAIVLPGDWRQWDAAKLDAVLAHERSHILRHDPAVQLLSAIHRVLLWHSPLSWFLHRRIVRVAEEASDDAAVAVTRSRAFYAEVLLDFMRRAVPRPSWHGVPMARYGAPAERIQRILDGATLSRGVTRWGAAAILALGAPLAYLVAAVAQPQAAPQAPPPTPKAPVQASADKPVKPSAQNPAQSTGPAYLTGLGTVSPYTTVIVRPRIDGQLMSVSFTEGSQVQAGQVLATIDSQPYQLLVTQAEGQVARDQEGLIGGALKTDQAKLDNARLQLSYAQVRAPITGVVGLRLVDPGNIVHATDTTGIVIINQIQPISVLFTIPEDSLPQVLARLRQGAAPPVEAWTRTNSAKIATGRLTAVDNQIDADTGTAKLKAVFDNKDGALFPNEFVNVRLR